MAKPVREWDIRTSAPLVSVCIITYNHENYLEECVESILDQEVSFPVEIVIGEDASSDSTASIVAKLATANPNSIVATTRSENIGGVRNYFDTHASARGRFVAHMDGDDYALPGKIESQASVLLEQPEIALATHAVLSSKTLKPHQSSDSTPRIGYAGDLLMRGAYFVHSSTMYRAENRYPAQFHDGITDFEVSMAHALRGGIYFDSRPLGVYRVHSAGLSSDAGNSSVVVAAYERAFTAAEKAGLDRRVVDAGRLRFRRSQALAQLAANNVNGFRQQITIPAQLKYAASQRHHFENFIARSGALSKLYGSMLRSRWAAD